MDKALRIIYGISISTILIWISRPVVFGLIGLEFADQTLRFDYSFSWRFILPTAICLTISREYINGQRPQSLIKSILLRVGWSLLAVCAVYIAAFTTICAWNEKEVFYESKLHSGKIVLMEYDCGAYDSDADSSVKVKKVKPFNSLFNWVHDCDTTSINLADWTVIK